MSTLSEDQLVEHWRCSSCNMSWAGMWSTAAMMGGRDEPIFPLPSLCQKTPLQHVRFPSVSLPVPHEKHQQGTRVIGNKGG